MSNLFEPSVADPDGIKATKSPFKRPVAGDATLLWFLHKQHRSYSPFMVEVTANTTNSLTFFLLDKTTGQRAHANSITENPNDYRKIYGRIPSTAQDADPADPNRNCGFLFLTSDYTAELVSTGKITQTELATAQGSSKWPKGASSLVSGLMKLLGDKRPESLSPREYEAVRELLVSVS